MKYVVGNYKMNLSTRETTTLVKGVLHGLKLDDVLPEIVICPTFTALPDVQKLIKKTPVNLGAQNVAATSLGAHTGEVAAAQLVDVGCTHTLIGHSERRAAGESNDNVHAKIVESLAVGLTPIICVGETAAERAAGQTDAVITHQLISALTDVAFPRKTPCLVAYEPVWAIGADTPATTAQIIAVHSVIRRSLVSLGFTIDNIAVLYGGSVNAENALAILREREVDGVLVGGASLKIHEFNAIINAATEVMTVA